MSDWLKLAVLGLIAVAAAVAFSSHEGASQTAASRSVRTQTHRVTTYPNGGGDGPP